MDKKSMVADLAALVTAESPSSDLGAVDACADVVAEIGERHLGSTPERIRIDGRQHLRWSFGAEPKAVSRSELASALSSGALDAAASRVDAAFGAAAGARFGTRPTRAVSPPAAKPREGTGGRPGTLCSPHLSKPPQT